MFDIQAILEEQDRKRIVDMPIEGLVFNGEEINLILQVKITPQLKETEIRARRKYNGGVRGFVKPGKGTSLDFINEPESYLKEILPQCFEAVEGLFSGTPSKADQLKAFLHLVTRTATIAEYMAGLLISFFETDKDGLSIKKNS